MAKSTMKSSNVQSKELSLLGTTTNTYYDDYDSTHSGLANPNTTSPMTHQQFCKVTYVTSTKLVVPESRLNVFSVKYRCVGAPYVSNEGKDDHRKYIHYNGCLHFILFFSCLLDV
jgi:hypothetical protein